MFLPLVAPIVAVRSLLWQPLVEGAGAPLVYLVGVLSMAVAYGLYYAVRHPRYDTLWIYGVAFCFFYVAFLLWQTYYAIAHRAHRLVGHAPGHGRHGAGRTTRRCTAAPLARAGSAGRSPSCCCRCRSCRSLYVVPRLLDSHRQFDRAPPRRAAGRPPA